MTVTGPRPASEFGPAAAHEHIFIDLSDQKQDPDARLQDSAVAERELLAFRAAGGRAIVDVTPHGLGRRPADLRTLAWRTGLDIVCATGLYYGRFLPPWVAERSSEQIAEMFIKEALAGIDGTGVRPGVIGEIGSGRAEISPDEAKVFRAAAAAQRATGLPISTHCTGGAMAEEQLDLLEAAGADPARVIIGHQDLRADGGSHARLATRGAFVAFDTAGKEQYQSDAMRARLVLAMLERGLGDHVLISCDVTRVSYLHASGGGGYAHLLTDFRARLQAAGLSDREWQQLVVGNPARAFAMAGDGEGVGRCSSM
jgi:phosphotriesterase-related protein